MQETTSAASSNDNASDWSGLASLHREHVANKATSAPRRTEVHQGESSRITRDSNMLHSMEVFFRPRSVEDILKPHTLPLHGLFDSVPAEYM